MAKPARRRCKNDECREWFHPAFANQWWCSPECGTKIALERRSKEREKAEKAAEKKRRREEQKQKDKLKIRKLALKPRSYWIKQAQQAVNAFIRERDRDLPCISCGTLTSAQWDAGHYRTTAAAPQLRFDERNIHKQCVVCNQYKSGNLVPYRVELISRIGQEAVDEIESNHNANKPSSLQTAISGGTSGAIAGAGLASLLGTSTPWGAGIGAGIGLLGSLF